MYCFLNVQLLPIIMTVPAGILAPNSAILGPVLKIGYISFIISM